jgi:hypothetical protein
MAITNELSSEIACALLTAKYKSPEELSRLKEIVIKVHRTLQQMKDEERATSFLKKDMK